MIKKIKNIIRWVPVLWKDRDFDHVYLLIILRQKLKHMEEFFRSEYAYKINSKRDANNIHKCILLLNRLIEDEYTAFDTYYKKWGEIEFRFEDVDNELSQLFIDIENVKTKEDKERETKEFRKCCQHEEDLRNQDLSYLFKIMRKHIRTWWD